MRILIAVGLAGILALSLSGCIVPTVTQKADGVNFKSFKTISYSVHAAPNIETGDDRNFSIEEISLFNLNLGSRMRTMGYEVASDPAQADLCIDVSVTESKPGNRAARALIGYGAGRAVMTFDAVFSDAAGHKLASFKGGKSLTGEPGHIFDNNDEIQMGAVTTGMRQIMDFIANNGDIPVNARRK